MTTLRKWPQSSILLLKNSIQQGTLQSKLYKYRPISVIDNDGNKLVGGLRTEGIIKDSKFWFADPTSFNDPFDCHLSLESNLDAVGIEKKLTEFDLTKTLEKDQIKALLSDPIKFKETLETVANNCMATRGILALAQTHDNILMWSQYAESHTGIVFELDVEKSLDFFTIPMSVDYKEKYTSLDFINEENESIKRNIQLKSSQWSYEEEVRIVKMGTGNYPMERQAIAKIYFGCRSSDDDVDRIINLCQNHGLKHVEFYKSKTVEGKFELSFSRI